MNNLSSTQVKSCSYEEHLVRILSLPLETTTRQLAIPHIAQNYNFNFFFCGEGFSTQQNSAFPEMKQMESLNSLSAKLNSDDALAQCDHTSGETYEVPTVSALSEIDGLNSESETKFVIKPSTSTVKPKTPSVIAKLEDMPVEVQKKKGLLGLKFKIYKITNPQTKRL